MLLFRGRVQQEVNLSPSTCIESDDSERSPFQEPNCQRRPDCATPTTFQFVPEPLFVWKAATKVDSPCQSPDGAKRIDLAVKRSRPARSQSRELQVPKCHQYIRGCLRGLVLIRWLQKMQRRPPWHLLQTPSPNRVFWRSGHSGAVKSD